MQCTVQAAKLTDLHFPAPPPPRPAPHCAAPAPPPAAKSRSRQSRQCGAGRGGALLSTLPWRGPPVATHLSAPWWAHSLAGPGDSRHVRGGQNGEYNIYFSAFSL